jgi:hypothetical protein
VSDPDDEREKELNHSYQLGISSGLEQASARLLEASGKLWKKGHHDEDALLLREWSRKFAVQAKEAHPGRDP